MIGEKVQYNEVTYHELDDFVNTALGLSKTTNGYWDNWPWEFVQAHYNVSNDSCYTFNVRDNMEEWDKKEMEQFLANPISANAPNAHTVLTYLCSIGKMEEGNYLVVVSW